MDILSKNTYNEEVYSIRPRVTVVIGKPWAEVSLQEKELLDKILKAIGFSADGVRIRHQVEFRPELLGIASLILVFGAKSTELTRNEILSISGTSVVITDPLDSLLGDDEGKRKLWGALKLFKPQ